MHGREGERSRRRSATCAVATPRAPRPAAASRPRARRAARRPIPALREAARERHGLKRDVGRAPLGVVAEDEHLAIRVRAAFDRSRAPLRRGRFSEHFGVLALAFGHDEAHLLQARGGRAGDDVKAASPRAHAARHGRVAGEVEASSTSDGGQRHDEMLRRDEASDN